MLYEDFDQNYGLIGLWFLNVLFLLQSVFQTCPLTGDEWIVVMKFSLPVVLLDESLKFTARKFTDGKGYLPGLHWIFAMWGVFFLLVIYGPI